MKRMVKRMQNIDHGF